ncbi:DUF2461 domain-containing protein [Candidatus Thalassolituus haligoni]|uniref:DUF2461 domain-containing protein n=1 Tax=Candidatus Thalassolituus haligoni TaxID=3100113 RepID=UPI0035110F9E|tara:strand:- start:9909 stop:10592 length:684 start_codon:yes stop_codon:yes gene_type:complete
MFTAFSPELLVFLRQLQENNNKAWFEQHKSDYELQVRGPALAFIAAMEMEIRAISPYYEAVAKKVGGSLMRPYRDTRFAKDKTPYKLNVGIQFRHESGKDIHAPGFYLHIAADEIFVGVGVWHPDSVALGKIRDALAERPARYLDAIGDNDFQQYFQLDGDSLIRPPKGYDKDHPQIDELKRKDFIALAALDEETLYQPDCCDQIARRFRAASNFQSWLCDALGLRY